MAKTESKKQLPQDKVEKNEVVALDQKREQLVKGLEDYGYIVETLPSHKKEHFKSAFLELASQEYLLNMVSTKELIRFAVNVTKIGLDIAPSAKEVYIVPFETKVQNVKIMLPQAIIPLNGIQQMAYQKKFFLRVNAVYQFDDGSFGSEAELTRTQQVQLKTADPEWVDKHFIGFDVVMADLTGEIPEQTKFVEVEYVKEATKTIKDIRWKLQTWRHKAVRRAYGDFMVPRERAVTSLEKIEQLNDDVLKAETIEAQITSKPASKKPKTLEEMGLKEVVVDGGLIIKGDTYGKSEILEKHGYAQQEDGVFFKSTSNKKPKEKKPAAKLLAYLYSKGLSKEESGHFVSDVLKVTSKDEEAIVEYLNDLGALEQLVEEYKVEIDF